VRLRGQAETCGDGVMRRPYPCLLSSLHSAFAYKKGAQKSCTAKHQGTGVEPKPLRAKVRAAKSALIRVDDVASGLAGLLSAARRGGATARRMRNGAILDRSRNLCWHASGTGAPARERRRSSEASPIDQRERWPDIQNLLEDRGNLHLLIF
jgi:hypothetical protein